MVSELIIDNCQLTTDFLFSPFYLQYAAFISYLVSLNSLRNRQALTCADIKLPTVQGTLDNVPADHAVRQWGTLVRTKVFDGIIFATNIENSYFVAIRKLHSSAFAR